MYRFVSSLTDKVYATPPSIDKLADLFQDFYIRAAAHISTHISTLSSRQHRGNSPNPSVSSRSSSTITLGTKVKPKGSKESLKSVERATSEQQMLTSTEILDKRRLRRLLEQKRLAMEEAVERRACECVYDRIWRHRSTLDEVRDEKLRSRTAALALVGIGLNELGVDIDIVPDKTQASAPNPDDQVCGWFAPARESLSRMNDEKYPLGKLQHLAAAHKSIVDVLSRMQTSSSSADEILPTLIYTLLTTPTKGINVISNLHFIQRFRAVNKVDGEAAYCLTNLEAAISFLETVDLASLRAEELLEGPGKSNSQSLTPLTEKTIPFGPLRPSSPSLSAPITTPAVGTSSTPTTVPSPSPASSRPTPPTSPLHQRRLSHLLQPSTDAIEAASDAVRTTADQGFKTISNTLDNSFKFLFGRLKEQEMSNTGNSAVVIPKTLEDARRLVSPITQAEDIGNINGTSSTAEQTEGLNNTAIPKDDDKMLGLFSGRKQTRERSVDSTQSNGSGKRVTFAANNGQNETSASLSSSAPPAPGNAAMESMRNLGNTLNPLNRLAGMNVMRGFSRTTSNTPPALPASAEKSKELGVNDAKPNVVSYPETVQTPNIAPPISRFLEMEGPGDLKIAEVTELLEDYRRLARALKDMRAFR